MTGKEKQLLTVTGTLLAVAAVAVLGLVPYVKKWQEYDKVIDQRASRIQTLKRQVANKPALQNEIALMSDMMASSKLFFPVATKQAAEAQLLATVKKMIEDAKGQIHSVNILNQRQGGAKNTAAVKINFTIVNNGLVDVLQKMAGSRPLLNVITARLTPLLKRQRNKQTDTGKVRIDMVIEGFYSDGGQS